MATKTEMKEMVLRLNNETNKVVKKYFKHFNNSNDGFEKGEFTSNFHLTYDALKDVSLKNFKKALTKAKIQKIKSLNGQSFKHLLSEITLNFLDDDRVEVVSNHKIYKNNVVIIVK